MQTTHLVALAVDMPFMTSEQMHVLCSLATNGVGVLPRIGDRAEPLAAVYPREAARELSVALSGRDFSLQRWSSNLVEEGKLHVFKVAQDEEGLYRSMNEPGDLKEGRFPNRPPGNVGGL